MRSNLAASEKPVNVVRNLRGIIAEQGCLSRNCDGSGTAGSGVGVRSPVSLYQLCRIERREAGPYCCGRLVIVFLALTVAEARAETCPQPTDEIATDRPDVTNSSLVVPVGSFQSENGVNLTARDGGRNFDGSDTRWRLGIAP